MRKFFQKCLYGLLRGVFLMAVLYGISFAVLYFYADSNKPQVPDSCVLVIDISSPWTEGTTQSGVISELQMQLSGKTAPASLLQSVDSIRKAKDDPRVKAILVTGDIMFQPSTIGLAGYAELAQAIADFSEVKPSFSYMSNPGLPEMLVASHCRYRFINPAGTVFFQGIGTETLLWGEAFERYGVGVQAIRAGAFKSAVEPYTRSAFTPEAKSQQLRSVEALWDTYTRSYNPEVTDVEQLNLWAKRWIIPSSVLAGHSSLRALGRRAAPCCRNRTCRSSWPPGADFHQLWQRT